MDRRPAAPNPIRALLALGIAGLLTAPVAAVEPGPVFSAAQARAAVAMLADAPSHGLDARDYGTPALAAALERALATAPAAAPPPPLQHSLATATRRYLQELHRGRVAPEALAQRFAPMGRATGHAAFDADEALHAALALQDLREAERRAAPPLAQYRRLREALATYRALQDHPAWQRPLPALPLLQGRRVRALEPGMAWDGVPALAARLQALGDLAMAGPSAAAIPAAPATAAAPAPPAVTTATAVTATAVGLAAIARAGPGAAPVPGTASTAPVFDAALVAALQSFQQRHGLDPDGVLGRATLAALEVPPGRRARQLELALERLRWTPFAQGPRMIVVNVPEFVLRAYAVEGERIAVELESRVIVGQALDTRTPLINEELRRIEFQPFWNVPASIARKELVPRLARDPAHWAREGFEFVPVAGGAPDPTLSAAKLQAVLDGALRIRQRPGPRNALGDIKFVFPNRESVYLHHTPSVKLFERARRDFSHGCIRVDKPVELAAFALHGTPLWDEARIRAAMDGPTPTTVALAQPVPVLIAYVTALVKGGRVHFFDDLYGHDRALERALAARAPARTALPTIEPR